MTKNCMVFKYSGSKRTLLPLMRKLPSHKRVVEPYLGGGAFLLNNEAPGLGIDINRELINLWKYLRDEATPERLYELERIRQNAIDTHPTNKPDVRDIDILEPEKTYLRINAASVIVGQLSSYALNIKHKLPIQNTINYLNRLKELEFVCGDANVYSKYQKDGDILLIDPPYFGTKGNYKTKGADFEKIYTPKDTAELINNLDCPIIFTYGSDAKEVFPDFDWEVLCTKKVPNIRKGGTIDRVEHVSYINWR